MHGRTTSEFGGGTLTRTISCSRVLAGGAAGLGAAEWWGQAIRQGKKGGKTKSYRPFGELIPYKLGLEEGWSHFMLDSIYKSKSSLEKGVWCTSVFSY